MINKHTKPLSFALLALCLFFLISCSFFKKWGNKVLLVAESLIPEAKQELLHSLVSSIDKKHLDNMGPLGYLEKIKSDDVKKIENIFKLAVAIFERKNYELVPKATLTDKQKKEVMAIVEEADKHWFDFKGFMRLHSNKNVPDNAPDNENPMLFTSEYFYVLWRLGVLEGDLKDHYFNYIKEKMAAMMLQPGLYDRNPISMRATTVEIRSYSHDEQAGAITIDTVFDHDLGYTHQARQYGHEHLYVFNNRGWSGVNQFNKKVTQGGREIPKIEVEIEALRLPSFIEYIRVADGTHSGLITDALICSGMLIGAYKDCGDTSSKMMSFLKVASLSGKSDELDACFAEFIHKMQKTYAKGQSCNGKQFSCNDPFCNVAEIYFQDPNHPIRLLARYL